MAACKQRLLEDFDALIFFAQTDGRDQFNQKFGYNDVDTDLVSQDHVIEFLEKAQEEYTNIEDKIQEDTVDLFELDYDEDIIIDEETYSDFCDNVEHIWEELVENDYEIVVKNDLKNMVSYVFAAKRCSIIVN